MSEVTDELLFNFLLRRIKDTKESQEHWKKNKAEYASIFTWGMQLAFEETLRVLFFPTKKVNEDE